MEKGVSMVVFLSKQVENAVPFGAVASTCSSANSRFTILDGAVL
jgi:hypothetical protein